MNEVMFTPAEFVAILNQTIEYSYPVVTIEGELSNFRVSKNRWVYFDLKDDAASVSFFGTVYILPGPLQDGLTVRVSGSPKLHPRFGFSVTAQSIQPVGEGSLKKAADLLAKKLAVEGLFDADRKRLLPTFPEKIGLITAAKSAAAADFIKILNEKWGGLEVSVADVYVQGDKAPLQIASAISYFNQMSELPEVLVITRGGGSADDLVAFSDERVVRAIAASRIPTLVAIGHEVDLSLAEMAADQRASTPSNAAQLLVPDKHHELAILESYVTTLKRYMNTAYDNENLRLRDLRGLISGTLNNLLIGEKTRVASLRKLTHLYDPLNALRRGYALVSSASAHIRSVKDVSVGSELRIQMHDGTIAANVTKVVKG